MGSVANHNRSATCSLALAASEPAGSRRQWADTLIAYRQFRPSPTAVQPQGVVAATVLYRCGSDRGIPPEAFRRTTPVHGHGRRRDGHWHTLEVFELPRSAEVQ